MSGIVLFSLENCIKCMQTKELLADEDNIKVYTFPHDFSKWTDDQLDTAKSYDIFEDLQITAPILWKDGEKITGYLRIRKWLKENR
jgi:hypothetical protein